MESSSLSKFDYVMFLIYAFVFGFVCSEYVRHYSKEPIITGGTCLAGEIVTTDSRGVPYCQPRHFECTQEKVTFSITLPDNATCK